MLRIVIIERNYLFSIIIIMYLDDLIMLGEKVVNPCKVVKLVQCI